MAETRITNVVTPEVFTSYTFEPWYEKSRYFRSGILTESSEISSMLAGGGKTFNAPYWQPLAGDSDVPSETVDQTVNAITSGKQIARRQERTKAYGANAISAIRAGSEPLSRFANDVREFWAKAWDKNAISSTRGVYADNVANDSSDLVHNGSAASFNDDGVIDAQGKLGENGVVGSDDNEDYVGIAVHPDIYKTMRKNDAIDFVPISGQKRPVPFYMGMEVIVDRNMPIISTSPNVYLNVIYKNGAIQFGQSSAHYEPTSFERDEGKGMGITEVYTRRVFTIHPVGTAWQESSVAGLSPTEAELETAANWDRVYNKENMRFVFYTSQA
jgi:hypothetical protein